MFVFLYVFYLWPECVLRSRLISSLFFRFKFVNVSCHLLSNDSLPSGPSVFVWSQWPGVEVCLGLSLF